jgi:signal transduction histidine kinase
MVTNQVAILLFAGTAFFMLVGFIITFLIIRHNSNLNNINTEKNKLLSESRLRHIEENERMMNQISKELHDNIGQSASLIFASLNKIESFCTDEQVLRLVTNAKDLSNQLLQDAKNISHSLNQNYIKSRSLHSLLQQNLEHLKSFKNIQSEFIIEGEPKNLYPETKLIVYRIAQEAFQNILKHAGATEISITLFYGEQTFRMRIQDNGIGLVKDTLHNRDGIGLTNMRERAVVLNGELMIEAPQNSGCCVTLSVREMEFDSNGE